jgi:hypothetical protein
VGVIYGCRPNDDCPVIPAPSPLLDRLGLLTDEDKRADPATAPNAGEYVAARVKAVHSGKTYGTAPGTVFTHKGLKVLENYAAVDKDGVASI